MNKQKIILAIVAIGLALMAIFKFGFYDRSVSDQSQSVQEDPNKPQIVMTDPNPLEGGVLLSTQPIKITFNVELENGPETKLVFDPPIEHKAEISGDRKTLILTPLEPYPPGQSYTLTIKSDAKLANKTTLGFDKEFHFRTLAHSGI